MLQRIFLIASLTFAFSILALIATGVGFFLTGSSGWSEFELEHTGVSIRSVQPSCLRIQRGERMEYATHFDIENRCGGEIVFPRVKNRGQDDYRSPEEELEFEISGQEYTLYNESAILGLFQRWETHGSVGSEPFIIKGITYLTPLGIAVRMIFFSMYASFAIIFPFSIAIALNIFRGKRRLQ